MSRELTLFGKIIRTHGNSGALVIKQDSFSKAKLKNPEPVFVDIQPTPVPFFIEKLLTQNNDLLTIKFEFINTPEQAARYCGLSVLIERKKSAASKEFQPDSIIGYSVTDEEHGDIGTISGLLEMPQQILLQIDNNGREILIPVNDDFIKKIDQKNKKIEISAPAGLINLYLE